MEEANFKRILGSHGLCWWVKKNRLGASPSLEIEHQKHCRTSKGTDWPAVTAPPCTLEAGTLSPPVGHRWGHCLHCPLSLVSERWRPLQASFFRLFAHNLPSFVHVPDTWKPSVMLCPARGPGDQGATWSGFCLRGRVGYRALGEGRAHQTMLGSFLPLFLSSNNGIIFFSSAYVDEALSYGLTEPPDSPTSQRGKWKCEAIRLPLVG